MTALRRWLAAPGPLGVSRWRWLLTALACLGVAVLWRPLMAWLPLSWLLGAPRRIPASDPAPDPARPAQDAHSAALETDRALRGVQAESAAREAAGAQAARTDDADEVAARVAARGRR